MGQHPLIERAGGREVRQAKGFREAAAALTGETLAAEFAQEKSGAPVRGEAGKKHLQAPNKRLAAERKPSRDSEHAALALVNRKEAGGMPMILPDDEGTFEALVYFAFPLPRDTSVGRLDATLTVSPGKGASSSAITQTRRFAVVDRPTKPVVSIQRAFIVAESGQTFEKEWDRGFSHWSHRRHDDTNERH